MLMINKQGEMICMLSSATGFHIREQWQSNKIPAIFSLGSFIREYALKQTYKIKQG